MYCVNRFGLRRVTTELITSPRPPMNRQSCSFGRRAWVYRQRLIILMPIPTKWFTLFRPKPNAKHVCPPLEFMLAVLNSRAMYYFLAKKHGETEWRSHPYLTQKQVLDLPMPAECTLRRKSAIILQNYGHSTSLHNVLHGALHGSRRQSGTLGRKALRSYAKGL